MPILTVVIQYTTARVMLLSSANQLYSALFSFLLISSSTLLTSHFLLFLSTYFPDGLSTHSLFILALSLFHTPSLFSNDAYPSIRESASISIIPSTSITTVSWPQSKEQSRREFYLRRTVLSHQTIFVQSGRCGCQNHRGTKKHTFVDDVYVLKLLVTGSSIPLLTTHSQIWSGPLAYGSKSDLYQSLSVFFPSSSSAITVGPSQWRAEEASNLFRHLWRSFCSN